MHWDTAGWFGWMAMTLAMLAFWAVVIVGIASLLGLDRRRSLPGRAAAEQAHAGRRDQGVDRRGSL
jgi:hypothetical protein